MAKKAQDGTPAPPGGVPGGTFGFLQAAIKAVPAVRYALGVGGIAAVIAIVASFLDLRIALVGIPILFVFMVVLVIFARLADNAPGLRWAISALVWFSVLLLIFATALFVLTFFVRADILHGWGLNSFYDLFGWKPASPPTTKTP